MLQNQNDFNITVTIDEDTYTLMYGKILVDTLLYDYFNWSFLYYTDVVTPDTAYNFFKKELTDYIDEKTPIWTKAFEALLEKYHVGYDFFRHEITNYKNEHEISFGKAIDNSVTDYETTTEFAKTENKVSTFDDATYRNDTEIIRGDHNTDKDKTTVNGSTNTTESGTETTTDTRLGKDNDVTVEGYNNNMTKAVEEELKMRINNDISDIIIHDIVKRFFMLLA
jgi:hypothetical protein